MFAIPADTAQYPVEKISDPTLGFYTESFTPHKLITNLFFGMSRYEG